MLTSDDVEGCSEMWSDGNIQTSGRTVRFDKHQTHVRGPNGMLDARNDRREQS